LIFPEREYYLGKMGNDLPPKPAPKAEEVKEVIYAEGETLSSDFFLKILNLMVEYRQTKYLRHQLLP